jgi:hypothetical protein
LYGVAGGASALQVDGENKLAAEELGKVCQRESLTDDIAAGAGKTGALPKKLAEGLTAGTKLAGGLTGAAPAGWNKPPLPNPLGGPLEMIGSGTGGAEPEPIEEPPDTVSGRLEEPSEDRPGIPAALEEPRPRRKERMITMAATARTSQAQTGSGPIFCDSLDCSWSKRLPQDAQALAGPDGEDDDRRRDRYLNYEVHFATSLWGWGIAWFQGGREG